LTCGKKCFFFGVQPVINRSQEYYHLLFPILKDTNRLDILHMDGFTRKPFRWRFFPKWLNRYKGAAPVNLARASQLHNLMHDCVHHYLSCGVFGTWRPQEGIDKALQRIHYPIAGIPKHIAEQTPDICYLHTNPTTNQQEFWLVDVKLKEDPNMDRQCPYITETQRLQRHFEHHR
jgi:hypothetical protein